MGALLPGTPRAWCTSRPGARPRLRVKGGVPIAAFTWLSTAASRPSRWWNRSFTNTYVCDRNVVLTNDPSLLLRVPSGQHGRQAVFPALALSPLHLFPAGPGPQREGFQSAWVVAPCVWPVLVSRAWSCDAGWVRRMGRRQRPGGPVPAGHDHQPGQPRRVLGLVGVRGILLSREASVTTVPTTRPPPAPPAPSPKRLGLACSLLCILPPASQTRTPRRQGSHSPTHCASPNLAGTQAWTIRASSAFRCTCPSGWWTACCCRRRTPRCLLRGKPRTFTPASRFLSAPSAVCEAF